MNRTGLGPIVFPFAGETKGGSLQSTLLLISKLRELGFDARAICHGSGYAYDEAIRQGVPVAQISGFGGKRENEDRADGLRPANFLSMVHVRRAIRDMHPALVHLNEKRMVRTWALPARFCGVPTLIHWRTNYRKSFSIDLGLRLAQRIVCISQFSASKLPAWALAKSQIVYNPIRQPLTSQEREELRRRIRQSIGLKESHVLIGYFGNFSARKRPYLLLETVEQLRRSRGDAIFGLLCGSMTPPPDDRYLQRLAEKNWTRNVFMPGFVHDAYAWMCACDVIMAPALDEPWGRTLAEAQSLQIPVVAAAHGGHLETITDMHDGLLVDSGEPEPWSRAIGSILDSASLRRQLTQNGVKTAESLSVDEHVAHIIDVYRRMHVIKT